jgi:serine/threonine-protein kinase RsbW
MNPTDQPAEPAVTRLDRHGSASVELPTTVRLQLADWLRGLGASDDAVFTIGLATYEAMANAVLHAYPPGIAGQVEMHAWVDDGTVTVTVADHGQWKALMNERDPLRGRGLPLIRQLAEQAAVVPGDEGTLVRMIWTL